MSIVGAAVLVLGFVLVISIFDLVGKSSRVFAISKNVMHTLQDSSLDDLQKEKSMQAYSKTLFSLFFIILLICAVAVFIPLAVVKLMDLLGWLCMEDVMAILLSWQFILISSILVIVLAWIFRRK